MAPGYSIDTCISICVFSIDGLFGMDIAWTIQPGFIIQHLVSHSGISTDAKSNTKSGLDFITSDAGSN